LDARSVSFSWGLSPLSFVTSILLFYAPVVGAFLAVHDLHSDAHSYFSLLFHDFEISPLPNSQGGPLTRRDFIRRLLFFLQNFPCRVFFRSMKRSPFISPALPPPPPGVSHDSPAAIPGHFSPLFPHQNVSSTGLSSLHPFDYHFFRFPRFLLQPPHFDATFPPSTKSPHKQNWLASPSPPRLSSLDSSLMHPLRSCMDFPSPSLADFPCEASSPPPSILASFLLPSFRFSKRSVFPLTMSPFSLSIYSINPVLHAFPNTLSFCAGFPPVIVV